jgi:hypothetical protein
VAGAAVSLKCLELDDEKSGHHLTELVLQESTGSPGPDAPWQKQCCGVVWGASAVHIDDLD